MKSETRSLLRKGLNDRLAVLKSASTAARRPAHGWLKAVRESVGARQESVANRIGIKRQSYAELETAESRGSISINSLSRAADALDCDLIYFLVPRERVAQNYDDLAQLNDPLFKHLKASEHSMALEGQAVGDLTKKPSSRIP
jgi:predicted DNA-binding mobile mystery protein A